MVAGSVTSVKLKGFLKHFRILGLFNDFFIFPVRFVVRNRKLTRKLHLCVRYIRLIQIQVVNASCLAPGVKLHKD